MRNAQECSLLRMTIAHLQVCRNSHCQLCNNARAYHAVPSFPFSQNQSIQDQTEGQLPLPSFFHLFSNDEVSPFPCCNA